MLVDFVKGGQIQYQSITFAGELVVLEKKQKKKTHTNILVMCVCMGE